MSLEAIQNSYLLISSFGSSTATDTWVCEVGAQYSSYENMVTKSSILTTVTISYLDHKSPPQIPDLNHVNPAHIITPCSNKINYSIPVYT
jgi:hypothetical protein